MTNDELSLQLAQIKIELMELKIENLRHTIEMELIKKEIDNGRDRTN